MTHIHAVCYVKQKWNPRSWLIEAIAAAAFIISCNLEPALSRANPLAPVAVPKHQLCCNEELSSGQAYETYCGEEHNKKGKGTLSLEVRVL